MKPCRTARSPSARAFVLTIVLTAGCAVGNDPDAGTPPGRDGASTTACDGGQTRCGAACVDPQTDNAHCGMCGAACPVGQQCSAGRCAAMCPAGQSPCANACVALMTDPANCGACGTRCAPGQRCNAGRCELTCPAGQTSCGASCRDLAVDPLHCGTCDNACPTGQGCVMGRCELACPAGQTACGGVCRDLRTDNAHCGACGMACPMGRVCTMGRCELSCSAPLVVCGDRCADRASDPMNCGACGNACGPYPNAVAACAAGACRALCGAGFGDCNGALADGCEVNTQTSAAHCGGCSRPCSPPANGSATCAGGTCVITCVAGFHRCGASCASDTSPTACGAACATCPVPANGTATCTGGACGIACNAGFMPSGTTCVPVVGAMTTVTFPTMAAQLGGPTIGTPRTLGAGGGGAMFQIGDFITETFGGRSTAMARLDLNFQMSDLTSGCAVGQALSWRVLLNGTQVGTFGWTGGSGVNPRTVTQAYTFAPIAPAPGGQFTVRIEATTTVCPGGSSWNYLPGGSATVR